MDITCPNCGASNRPTSRFCAKCGQELPKPAVPSKEDSGDLNLPWLKGVQERATRMTGDLNPDMVPDEPPEPQAASQAQAQQAAPQPQQGAASQEAPPEGTSAEEAAPDQKPADEPPPEWVVGILEPASARPAEEGTYEPEEMEHIMPWLGEAGAAAAPAAGKEGDAQPPATPGLPPWLSGVTVQETLQTGSDAPEARVPDTSELGLEEGIEPFVPPELDPNAQQQPAPKKAAPPTSVPAWLKSIQPAAAEAQPHIDLPEAAEPVLPTGGLEPTGTLVEPVVRDIPVRPPRAGSVETLAALLQTPAGEVVARPVPGVVTAPEVTVRRGDVRHWFFPDGLIYLIILAALLAVLIIRPPFGEQNAPAAPDVLQFYSAIESAPTGKPVLVVYDWDAGRSAEMQALSEAVTNHLMSRRLHFVTLSTIPQGPGFAQQVTESVANDTKANYGYHYDRDYLVLGYLPGNEAALGALVHDFRTALPLDYVRSRNIQNSELIRGDNLQSLSDFSLIIDLASDEAALRNWVEQVATRVGVPVIAAVPQGMEPLARPYRVMSGAGLRAVVSGQAGALQYSQQLARSGRAITASSGFFASGTLNDRLNAQSIAQLLLALVIIGAFVRLGTQRIFRR